MKRFILLTFLVFSSIVAANSDTINSLLNEEAVISSNAKTLNSFSVAQVNSIKGLKDKPIKTSNIAADKANLAKTAIVNSNPSSLKPLRNLPQSSANDYTNLSTIDKDSNELNQLNRRLQLEKVEAEIRKLKMAKGNGSSSVLGNARDSAQTTVTGVAINAKGKKIAWLQFADGGDLTVNIGSSVGKYKVLDINMSGVTLDKEIGKHHHTIFLKRTYATSEVSHKKRSEHNSYFVPSPVVTSANSKSDYVPPIVSIGG